MEEVKQEYNWKEIEVNDIVLPSELVIYYLYKHKIDMLAKRNVLVNEDISFINNYIDKCGVE